MTRVFGDMMQKGFLIILADDLHVGGNTIPELLDHWSQVLSRLRDNNLRLSAPKTVICPMETTILGWHWKAGTLSPSQHKLAPLAAVEPPKTCTSMKSFVGACKAIARCVPRLASLISPLDDAIKGLQGSQQVEWTLELSHTFQMIQAALKDTKTLTLPIPSDKLILTVDASPSKKGLGATLFVERNGTRLVGEFFSFKLKEYQLGWLPCEHEALAISTAIQHFSPYIRESQHPLQVLTDSKPCVEAFNKLCKGHFSTSARVSTFLSTLSSYKVMLCHLSGVANASSDFSSRNPVECSNFSCQICKFVNESISSVISSISVTDILSGNARMPFLNANAWKSAQHECQQLRRTFAHLKQGTSPSRKSRNQKDLRKYLNVTTLDENGLLVVRKPDPHVHERLLIVIPQSLLPGILTALHLQLSHPTVHQLTTVFNRYFYALNSTVWINNVTNECGPCNALKNVPKEMYPQGLTPAAPGIGQLFAADVLKRSKQLIFVVRDIHSSFTMSSIIPDEKAATLRNALLIDTCFLRASSSAIKVDAAPGFRALELDSILKHYGITLDFGRVKNPNKTAVVDKAIQELELELLHRDPSGKSVSNVDLQLTVDQLNCRIRNRGLSAKEILLQRDQHTRQPFKISDRKLWLEQQKIRADNHTSSAKSKAGGGTLADNAVVSIGDFVYVKNERNKSKARDRYIIMNILGNIATIQKFNDTKFMSRKYEVPLNRIFRAYPLKEKNMTSKQHEQCHDTSDSEGSDYGNGNFNIDQGSTRNEVNQNNNADEIIENVVEESPTDSPWAEPSMPDDILNDIVEEQASRYPQRVRSKPAWMRKEEWELSGEE